MPAKKIPILGLRVPSNDVRILQHALGLPTSGVITQRGDRTIRNFQKANDLVVDGLVGAKTWEALGGYAEAAEAMAETIAEEEKVETARKKRVAARKAQAL